MSGSIRCRVGNHKVTITLPAVAGATMHHNELAEPGWHYTEHDIPLSRRTELAPFWGRVVVFETDNRTPKAASINRFRIAFDAAGDDDQVRDLARGIAEAVPVWWKGVSAWIEVLYGQDLSRLGPVEPGIYFTDTALWARLYSLHGHPICGGHVLPVGSGGFDVVHAPCRVSRLARGRMASQRFPPQEVIHRPVGNGKIRAEHQHHVSSDRARSTARR